jgi:hypothetical protein
VGSVEPECGNKPVAVDMLMAKRPRGVALGGLQMCNAGPLVRFRLLLLRPQLGDRSRTRRRSCCPFGFQIVKHAGRCGAADLARGSILAFSDERKRPKERLTANGMSRSAGQISDPRVPPCQADHGQSDHGQSDHVGVRRAVRQKPGASDALGQTPTGADRLLIHFRRARIHCGTGVYDEN